jgi:hypothetical protein
MSSYEKEVSMAATAPQTILTDADQARLALANHARYCRADGRHRPGCPICGGEPDVKTVTTRLTIVSSGPVTFSPETGTVEITGAVAILRKGAVNQPRSTGVTAEPSYGFRNPAARSSHQEQQEAQERKEAKTKTMGSIAEAAAARHR